MDWSKWVVGALAFITAGWMAYDGSRALIVGDYATPKSGAYAGQLGPWSKLVTAAGIAPRSTLMKAIFAIYGFAWLIITIFFVLKFSWARWAMIVAAIGALWYLPFGTLLSIIQIFLLLVKP
jgi:hypothetical protein